MPSSAHRRDGSCSSAGDIGGSGRVRQDTTRGRRRRRTHRPVRGRRFPRRADCGRRPRVGVGGDRFHAWAFSGRGRRGRASSTLPRQPGALARRRQLRAPARRSLRIRRRTPEGRIKRPRPRDSREPLGLGGEQLHRFRLSTAPVLSRSSSSAAPRHPTSSGWRRKTRATPSSCAHSSTGCLSRSSWLRDTSSI